MPIPKPASGESHDDFMSRCMADPVMQEYEGQQRYAVCETAWAEKSSHDSLLAKVQERKSAGHITTADRYVRRAVEEYGIRDGDPLIKDAVSQLVFCEPSSSKEAVGGPDVLPAGIVAPPKTLMIVRHVVTSSREDRDSDILHPEGAELDPKSPLLWQHLHTMPVGRVLAKLEQNERVLRVVSCILDLNELTKDIATLVEADCLRFSHGFIAKEWHDRNEGKEPAADQPPMMMGFEITRYNILEVSLVSVPSNADAEVELWSRGKLESDMMKHHAKSLFDKRAVQVQGIERLTDRKSESVSESAYAGPTLSPSEPRSSSTISTAAVSLIVDSDTKAGRVLSAANVSMLKDVVEDLDELAGMEIPRAAKALAERCRKRVADLVNASAPAGEESIEAVEIKDADEPAERSVIERVPMPHSAASVVAWLMEASHKEQQVVLRSIISLSRSDRLNNLAEQYRTFAGQQTAAR